MTEGKYKDDLNFDNPLGHHGEIAKAYAGFIASIYADPSMSSFTPRNIKATIGKHWSQFTGYGQQDSQEFLSTLVDGIHEDLNRILKKPYIENPEHDDNIVNDPEAIRALGQQFRENYEARNKSVCTDLFCGFYKNTMVCPECNKVSITFDPYNLLTLQLPIEQPWQHTIYFVPLYDVPVQIDVELSKSASIRSLKEYVAKKIPGLQWNRLVMTEVFSHKFYKIFDNDRQGLTEANISDRDDIVLYELENVPTNFPPPKKKQNKFRSMLSIDDVSSDEDAPDPEPSLTERMLVSVFHRTPSTKEYGGSKELQLVPFFIMLTREEAKDFDTILRKVLAKAQTLTSRPFIEELMEQAERQYGMSDSRSGSEPVLTTEEDASSGTENGIQARSVEGEDGMVDISMTETASQPHEEPIPSEESAQPAVPHKQRPSILDQSTFMPPTLQSLFQMQYMKAGAEMVPTGWSSLEASKDHATLESRIRLPLRRASMQSNASHISNRSSSGSDIDDIPALSNNVTSPLDGDADSDTDLPSIENIVRRHSPQNNRRQLGVHGKKMTTYSRKGSRAAAPTRTSVQHDDGHVDPALIKLGEAIILDWDEKAYDALFGGRDANDLRGVEMFDKDTMPVHSDPELEAVRERRAQRKKRGISLQDCFAETAKTEILSENNTWRCPRCKEERMASKTLEVYTVPDILIIHLKRFSGSRAFHNSKLTDLVDFPIEGLDVGPWVGLKDDKGTVYDLFAVDNHYGGLGGGHYTAFAQNFYDKHWYEYNGTSLVPNCRPEPN